MIFKDKLCQKVLDGTKTQTRRLVKDGDLLIRWPMPCVFRDTKGGGNRLAWRENQTYAVQPGRGKHAVGRIGIAKIRREKLQDASDADLLYEGIEFEYVGRDQIEVRQRAWRNLWNSIHPKGNRWEDNPDVWVLEFELVREAQ